MSRIQARDFIFKLIYEYLFLKNYNEISLENFLNEPNIDEENIIFIKNSYNSIIKNYNEIISIIENHLERYTLNKITKTDLSILIIAVNEICILNNPNIKVEINEAIELAKKYSNDNSFKFINGVLARIVNGIYNNGI